MKKLNFTVILLLLVNAIYSQVFKENFDGIGNGFSSWTLYNDNNTSADPFYQGAWMHHTTGLYTENFDNMSAISTSWFTSPNVADRWLVTPTAIAIDSESSLYFEEYAIDPLHKDGFKVLVSTTTNNKEAFTEEIYNTGEGGAPSTPTFKKVNLSSFIGKNIYIAFVNNSNDKFLLSLDNIYVSSPGLRNPHNCIGITAGLHEIDLSWENNNQSGNSQVLLMPYGEQPNGDGVEVSGSSHKFQNLPEGKKFHVYLKSTQDNSMWIGPYPATTAQKPPYNQDLEELNFSEQDVILDGFSVIDNTFFQDGGDKCAYSETDLEEMTSHTIKLPAIYIEAGTSLKISFDYITTTNEGNVSVEMHDHRPNPGTLIYFAEFTEQQNEVIHVEFTTEQAESSMVRYFNIKHTGYFSGTQEKFYLDNIKISVNGSSSIHEASSSQIVIAPNPVDDNFEIKNINTDSKVDIYDMMGKKVKSFGYQKTYQISDLPSGVYLVKVQSTNNKISEYKVVKR